MNPLKCGFGVYAGDFLGFVVHKKRHRDQPKQNKSNFGSQASFNKEAAPVFVREDKLLKKIYIKSKWQDEGFIAIAQDREGK